MDRRTFLASGVALGAAASTSPLAAVEPIKRNGLPKFKFSLAAYSYRSLLSGKNASLTLSDFVRDCAKMGLEGAELTSYYFPDPTTESYLRTLKGECFRLGLDISGTAIRNDFGYPPGEDRSKWLAHTKTWIDRAEILGAPVIRIFAGHDKKGVSPEKSHSLMVEGMQECCDYAAEHGVFLALENHGGPTSTAAGLLALVRDVDSPWFGVNLDTGNFRSEDPYADLAKAAPFALNVQVKVVIGGPGGKGSRPTDFGRIANILGEADYRGYVVLEYEEKGDPRQECPKFMDELRAAFA
jgi:sugar phosphate isomerase/epimerase